MQSPKIDERTKKQLIDQLEGKVQELTGWQPAPEGPPDAGATIIQIVARYAELIIERINRLPEKNFLAFLNLIGADVAPPQPARAPLTFFLADNSPVDALVPRGAQAAAPPREGEEDEVVFETVRELLVTRSVLTAVFTRQPDNATDTFQDVTTMATKPDESSFSIFTADQPLDHALYLGCPALAKLSEPTDVTVILHGDDVEVAKFSQLALSWAYWDGNDWQPLSSDRVVSTFPANGQWPVTLHSVPAVHASQINGQENSWLRVKPSFALPTTNVSLSVDAFATGAAGPVAATFPYYSFGPEGDKTTFYLNGEKLFGRPGAVAHLDVTLATTGAGDGRITWEYMETTDGDTKNWRPLIVEDGSNAFRQNGVFQVRIPADGSWNVGLYRNWSGRWLRATIDSPFTQAPQISAITTTLVWDLPQIRHISMRLPSGQMALPLAEGYFNRLELDVSKDFYPFGEQPRFNDTLYVSLPEAGADGNVKPGDLVSLAINLSTPGLAGGSGSPPAADGYAQLVWEFWNGLIWEELGSATNNSSSTGITTYGFNDATRAFTTSGSLQFRLPVAMNSTVNGVSGIWLRVRLVAGHYGHEAGYEPYEIVIGGDTDPGTPGTTITAYRLVPANFAPPIIATLIINIARISELVVTHCLALNEFVYLDHSAANAANTPFTPFTPTSDKEPALYLCFDRPFANRSVTLYAAVAPPNPDNVVPDKFKLAAAQTPAHLVWEYAVSPSGWGRLVVQDETDAFAERGLIRFTGPANFSQQPLFGQTGYWLRVRWQAGTFPVPPRLQYLLTNTTWAEQVQIVRDETLGSSNGNPGQTFYLAQRPVLPGQAIGVRESDLSADELTRIKDIYGDTAVYIEQDSPDSPQEIWVRWQEVIDFYGSEGRDRHYTLDHFTGELRFGDGQQGLIPPQGQNNIRAAQYRSGGGDRGNRDRQTIVQLKTSIPFVAEVLNYEAATGGAERQPIEQVERYGPRRLRHRNRAVTVEDVEDLAFAASSEVARSKAVPPRFRPMDLWLDPGQAPGLLPDHERAQAGNMGLIIVPHSSSPRPAPSPALVTRVRQYLQARCPAVANLWVSGPNWVEVKITTEVVPTSVETSDLVGEAVRAALSRYLHPLTGGSRGQGWSFGRKPYHSDLYALIEGVPGVDYVRQLIIEDTPDMSALQQVEQYLIYSGQHNITILNPPET